MFQRTDETLEQWVRSVVNDAPVSFAPPERDPAGTGVGLYLIEAAPKASSRGPRRPPLQITLKYLVTTWAPEPAASHRALGLLMFDAMKKPNVEVEPEPLPAAAWSALGVPPRPSFQLRTIVAAPWEEPLAPPAREARLDTSILRVVRGSVLRRDGAPAPRATVSFPALGLSTRTDAAGAFTFSAPAGEPVKLRVRADDWEAAYPPEPPATAADDAPLIVRIAGTAGTED